MRLPIQWARRSPGPGIGFECSSAASDPQGKFFSAFQAMMPDGRTIEHWYQCDIKAYDPGGTNWRLGKGKPSLILYPEGELFNMYLSLWKLWAIRHPEQITHLGELARSHGHMLTDCFASTPINQARALATILNEWNL
jgi:hypothetical protein